MAEPEPLRSTIDWAHLARQTADDAELQTELLTLFAEQARDIAQRLATPRTAGDDKTRRDLVHTLKGSSAAIGAFEVTRAAEACEAALATGVDADAALLAALDHALTDALAAIATRLGRR